MLADTTAEIDVARLLVWRASNLIAQRKPLCGAEGTYGQLETGELLGAMESQIPSPVQFVLSTITFKGINFRKRARDGVFLGSGVLDLSLALQGHCFAAATGALSLGHRDGVSLIVRRGWPAADLGTPERRSPGFRSLPVGELAGSTRPCACSS